MEHNKWFKKSQKITLNQMLLAFFSCIKYKLREIHFWMWSES